MWNRNQLIRIMGSLTAVYFRRSAIHVKGSTHVVAIAGRSPTFQDPGTPLGGLTDTGVPVNPIEQVLQSGPVLVDLT